MGLGDIGDYIDENWHGGSIEGDFFNHPDMGLDEEDDAEENLPRTSSPAVWNWQAALSRELMLGRRPAEIMSRYKYALGRFGVASDAREFLAENDGVLGWFVVDVSVFDDKFGYMDMPSEMRACNLYAMNSTALREVITRDLFSEGDGTMDGYLSSEDGVHEESIFVDEVTGLPCIDGWSGESDDDDERLEPIADRFLGWKWMSVAERSAFREMEGKLPYLVSIVRRAFAPKSKSDGRFEDDVEDYGVKDQDLEADSQKAVRDVEVDQLRNLRVDDVGVAEMPEKYDIQDEVSARDFDETAPVGGAVRAAEVGQLLEPKVDDIGSVGLPDKVEVEDEVSARDFDESAPVDRAVGDVKMDDLDEPEIGDIELEEPDYGRIDDDLAEHGERDYREDFDFDKNSEIEIDDLSEMKDDDFDYGELSEGDVDLDEMADLDAPEGELDIDEAQKPYEVSDKYDWSW